MLRHYLTKINIAIPVATILTSIIKFPSIMPCIPVNIPFTCVIRVIGWRIGIHSIHKICEERCMEICCLLNTVTIVKPPESYQIEEVSI